jgi:hypothetical protein
MEPGRPVLDHRPPEGARVEEHVNGSRDMGAYEPSGDSDPTRIPYTLHVEAVPPDDDGDWVYRVEYVELDNCVVEDRDLLRALTRLDSAREMSDEHGDDVIGNQLSSWRESER